MYSVPTMLVFSNLYQYSIIPSGGTHCLGHSLYNNNGYIGCCQAELSHLMIPSKFPSIIIVRNLWVLLLL